MVLPVALVVLCHGVADHAYYHRQYYRPVLVLVPAVAGLLGSGCRHDLTNLDSGCFHGIVAVAVVAADCCAVAAAAAKHMK